MGKMRFFISQILPGYSIGIGIFALRRFFFGSQNVSIGRINDKQGALPLSGNQTQDIGKRVFFSQL